jgi:RNA polymerase sigma factor (sigma-70 family)
VTDVAQIIALHLPAARRGNRKAFAALVAATQNTVTSVALAVVRDVQHSEDIAQEAYLAVWKRLKTLRNPDSFLPWLRQITRNLARDHLRRCQARPGDKAGTEQALWEQERDQAGRGDESAENSILRAEQDRLIALAGGIAGVILGLRPVIRSSTDPDELAALERLRAWGVAVVILAVLGFLVSAWLPGWLPATIVFVLFLSAIGVQHMVILPKILEPRLAAQRRNDPEAARRQRRQRTWAWIGMIGGGLGGLGGLIAGLVASGRIGF